LHKCMNSHISVWLPSRILRITNGYDLGHRQPWYGYW